MKGLSPIVAVVLLVAIAAALAAVVGMWLLSRIHTELTAPNIKVLGARGWVENGHLYVWLKLSNEGGASDTVVSVSVLGTSLAVSTSITVKPAQIVETVVDLGPTSISYTTTARLSIETASGQVIEVPITIEYRS